MEDKVKLTEAKLKKKKDGKDKKTKEWIPGVIQKEGALADYCRKKGYEGVTDECIRIALKSKDATMRRRAELAKTLREMS